MYRINPKVDIIFRKLFASEENEEVLKALISEIIGEELGEFKLKNYYNAEKYINNELDIFIVAAEDTKKVKKYDIYLLFELEKVYFEEQLANLLKHYIDNRVLENNYNQRIRTVLINIMDFTYSNKIGYCNSYALYNSKSNKMLNQLIEVYFIDLSKFNKTHKELSTILDKWVYFLNNGCKIDNDIYELFIENKFLLRAIDKLRSMYLDRAEQQIYEGQLGFLRDKVSALDEGQRRVAERVKRDIAKNLLTTNIEITNIAKATELALEEVLELRDDNK